MRVLPTWARKPKHKKVVIATDKGWVVKETGEVLVSHKGLSDKLESLYQEIEQLKIDEFRESDEPKTGGDPEPDNTSDEKVEQTEEKGDAEKVEVKEETKPAQQPKKRRGRPPKKKNASTNTTK